MATTIPTNQAASYEDWLAYVKETVSDNFKTASPSNWRKRDNNDCDVADVGMLDYVKVYYTTPESRKLLSDYQDRKIEYILTFKEKIQ